MVRKWLVLATFCCTCASSTIADAQTRLPDVRYYGEGESGAGSAPPPPPTMRGVTFNYPSVLSESNTASSLPSVVTEEQFDAEVEAHVESHIEAHVPPKQSGRPPGKPGLLQQLTFGTTWIPSVDSADDYGTVKFELSAVLGVPMPTRESPMLIKPGFEMHLLNGSVGVDLPEKLYDHYVQIRWLRKLGESWGLDLSVTPGIHGDFEEIDGDAFRLTAHALFSYDWSPELMLVGGVLYLDSDVLDVVPAAGAIYKPDADTRMELIVPRPRYAKRYCFDQSMEKWWYVAGEYASEQWSITRDGDIPDVLSMRDFKLLVGLERKDLTNQGLSTRLEAGYVFGRELEFRSGHPDIDGGDTAMMRASVSY